MNVINHRQYAKKRAKTNKRRTYSRNIVILCLVTVLVSASLLTFRLLRPLPSMSPKTNPVVYEPEQLLMRWPGYGQAAVGELESGVLAASEAQTPQPTASVAKVMTALAVLKQKPISSDKSQPVLVLTDTDVNSYYQYISQDGSVVQVVSGEEITEYQALQAMLLPSANNMADSLARWAFGSVNEYTKFANNLALSLGMKHTTIADASGFSPKTVSTAHDLVLLGQAALKEPIIAEIVAQQRATIPVASQIYNVNTLLNTDGINGIKTGNTEEAGGCFLVSATRTMSDGKQKTLIAAVMGAPSRTVAMNDSRPLLQELQSSFALTAIIHAGQIVGEYQVPWGQTVRAVVKDDISLYSWKGQPHKVLVDLEPIRAPLDKGQKVGTVFVDNNRSISTAVVLESLINSPSTSWRLRH